MKFRAYMINEAQSTTIPFDNPKEMYKIVMKHCALFVQEMKDGRKLKHLYRGTRSLPFDKNAHVVSRRTDRRPMNTSSIAHEYLDNYFKKKFGWKARSEGIFVETSAQVAGDYGREFMFFPVGSYDYIYNPAIDDLYMFVPAGLGKGGADSESMAEFEKRLAGYKDSGLASHLGGTKHFEIMFNCPKYIMISAEYRQEFDREFSIYRGN